MVDAAAASATKRRLNTKTPSGNTTQTTASHSKVDGMSPVNARDGNSHHAWGSRSSRRIISTMSCWFIRSSPRVLMLNSWKVRNTAAPASALITCASTRVRFGPIRRKRPVTMSNAIPVAANASEASTTSADNQSGEENTAIQSNGGPSMPA